MPRCQPKGMCGACCPQQSAQFARPAYSTQLCLTPTGADLTRHSLPECCRSATMSPWSLGSTRGLRFLPRQCRGMSAPSEHQRLRSAAAISTGALTSTTSLANAASQCLSERHRSGVDAPTARAVHPSRPHLQTAQPHQIGHETGHCMRLGHPFPESAQHGFAFLRAPVSPEPHSHGKVDRSAIVVMPPWHASRKLGSSRAALGPAGVGCLF